MSEDLLTVEVVDAVAVVRLARPAKRNALNERIVVRLGEVFADPPPGVRAAVLTGDGDHFCAGLDLEEHSRRTPFEAMAISRRWHRAFETMEHGRIPIVAALRGAVACGPSSRSGLQSFAGAERAGSGAGRPPVPVAARVLTDPRRALEFLRLRQVGSRGLTLIGSGRPTVTTPPLFRGRGLIRVRGASPATTRPDSHGRIRFTVDLGPPDTQQEDTPGATPALIARTVTFGR